MLNYLIIFYTHKIVYPYTIALIKNPILCKLDRFKNSIAINLFRLLEDLDVIMCLT